MVESDIDRILAISFGILDVIAFYWAWKEHRINRDFRSLAKGWLSDARTIASVCTNLSKKCQDGEIRSARDAGGRIEDAVCWPIHNLVAKVGNAVETPTFFQRILATFKR